MTAAVFQIFKTGLWLNPCRLYWLVWIVYRSDQSLRGGYLEKGESNNVFSSWPCRVKWQGSGHAHLTSDLNVLTYKEIKKKTMRWPAGLTLLSTVSNTHCSAALSFTKRKAFNLKLKWSTLMLKEAPQCALSQSVLNGFRRDKSDQNHWSASTLWFCIEVGGLLWLGQGHSACNQQQVYEGMKINYILLVKTNYSIC